MFNKSRLFCNMCRGSHPAISRVWVALFGVAWCSALGATVVATRSAASVIPLFMLVLGGALSWRLFTMCVVANADGLFVRNNVTSKHYSWDEVEGFRIGAQNPPVMRTINVLLHNGEMRTLDATTRLSTSGNAKRLERWSVMLQAWLPGAPA